MRRYLLVALVGTIVFCVGYGPAPVDPKNQQKSAPGPGQVGALTPGAPQGRSTAGGGPTSGAGALTPGGAPGGMTLPGAR